MKIRFKLNILLIVCTTTFYAQTIELTSQYSPNQICEFQDQKLVLLDFWATWCEPCVPATKQLEIFQETNKDKLFVISITDENDKKIKRFLERNPINLMVATDTDKKNILKYNVTSRPYAVLLDLKGKLLWKGHPADLSQTMLDDFDNKSQKNKTISLDQLVVFKTQNQPTIVSENVVFKLGKTTSPETKFEITETATIYSGSMSKLVGILNNKSEYQIEVDKTQDFNIELMVSAVDWQNKTNLLNKISNQFNLTFETIEKEQFAKKLEVLNPDLLWKTNNIVWDETTEKYLIGETKITANDITMADLSLILSSVKNENYFYEGNNIDLYDWDFQFLYNDIMTEDLSSTFGIGVSEGYFLQKIIKISFN